jgi:hypothetical protein
VEEGIEYEKAFVTTPLCCPSRASILRGQYAHNHEVWENARGFPTFRRLGHERSTIATWLRKEGYETALLGKYLNAYDREDYRHVPPGWDEWRAMLEEAAYYDYTLSENGEPVRYGSAEADYSTGRARRAGEGDNPVLGPQRQAALHVPRPKPSAWPRAPRPAPRRALRRRAGAPPAVFRRGGRLGQTGMGPQAPAAGRGPNDLHRRRVPRASRTVPVPRRPRRGRGRRARVGGRAREHLHLLLLRQRAPDGRAPDTRRQGPPLRGVDRGAPGRAGTGAYPPAGPPSRWRST